MYDVQQPQKVGKPCRNSKEVALLFGYKAKGLMSAVNAGIFPEPDFVAMTHKGKRLYWHLDTLQKEQKRRNNGTF